MREFIKRLLPSDSFIYRFISKVYNYNTNSDQSWLPPQTNISLMLDKFAELVNSVSFIQIGSNDGISGDPIYKYVVSKKWRGILVEPVPSLFIRLKESYKNYKENLIFENSAIATKNGKAKFYRLKETADPNMPKWYDQLGSFNKEIVIRHKEEIPNFDSLLIEDTINTITFNSLIKKYNFFDINLIHVDTEGFDYEILKLIDFGRIKPKIILYEHKHLHPKDHKKSIQLLQKNGYRLFVDGRDTIAINPELKH